MRSSVADSLLNRKPADTDRAAPEAFDRQVIPFWLPPLTALAGFPVEDADFSRLDRLKNINVAMFVGTSDQYWKEGMEKTRDRLRVLGQPVCFEAVPRNGHFLPDLSFENSARIFERIGRADC